MKKTVDARGLSCPEPVLMLKRAIADADEIELLSDSMVCVENCTRFAEAKGFTVAVSGKRGEYTMTLMKG